MKAYFLSRLFREKVLLLLFAVGITAVVLSATVKKVSEFITLDRLINDEAGRQRRALSQKASIQARADEAAKRFDSSKTYDSLRLASEIESMTRAVGIKNSSTGDAHSEQSSQFSLHSLQLTIRNADYGSLVKFYIEVGKHSPYIGIDQFAVQANAANPAQLNAVLRLTSVEVIR